MKTAQAMKKYVGKSELLGIFGMDNTDKIFKWNDHLFGKVIIETFSIVKYYLKLHNLMKIGTIFLLNPGKNMIFIEEIIIQLWNFANNTI